MGHLIICIKDPETITFGVNLVLIEFDGKVAKNADFSQKFRNFYVSMHIHNFYDIKNEEYFIFKWNLNEKLMKTINVLLDLKFYL